MEFPFDMLRALKVNWDSYGGVPIPEPCILKAYGLWRQLDGHWDVVPGGDGSIQLEQHSGGFDIEIQVSAACSQSDGGTERG